MNILLIVCDTLRVDHLGCYGYFRDTSPNIDVIAEDGVVFEDFYNSGAPTGPGFTCLYTGLHTVRHKQYQFQFPNLRQLDDRIFTMPEILRGLGYTTAAVDNLVNFSCHSKHWVRGYEYYINVNQSPFAGPNDSRAEQVNSRLLPWIRHHSDEKFFLFVHYWDPHFPYNQPQKYREIFHQKSKKLCSPRVEAAAGYEYVPGWGKVGEIIEELTWRGQKVSIDLYDGEIRYVDDAIGEVVSTLEAEKIFDETLIIVTSDHGEMLGQHNFWEHARIYDEVTHIPLIMRYPEKLPEGVEVNGFAQHIDILPTLLDLIGARTDALEIDGESMLPLLRGEQIRDMIFQEHSSGERAIRTSEWKYYGEAVGWWWHRPQRPVELYDVKKDPMETINLAEEEDKVASGLKEILNEWVSRNLKEGEEDPAVSAAAERRDLDPIAREYQEKTSRLVRSLTDAEQ